MRRMESVKVQDGACPSCRAILGAVTGPGDGPTPTPTPGDLTVCAYCATILAFEIAGALRAATEADVAELTVAQRTQLSHIQQAIEAMIALGQTPKPIRAEDPS